jgi:predicted dienelactone hydrolase
VRIAGGPHTAGLREIGSGHESRKPSVAAADVSCLRQLDVAQLCNVKFFASMPRRLRRALFVVTALSAALVVILSVALAVERRSVAELPAPTGPFAVGRVIYDWRDTSHEVLAWVWYPAASAGPADDYIPAQMRALETPPVAPIRWVARDRSKVNAHGTADARMPPGVGTYPVAILRGGGSTSVSSYTSLAEDLASHGYVVMGVDVPTLTSQVVFSDGRVSRRTAENDLEEYPDEERRKVAGRLLTIWTSHVSFALDRLAALNASDPSGRLTGRLDLMRVGAFGHSFGGAQSAQFCHDDARCVAAIDIDGMLFGSVIAEGMPKPFMFLMEGRAGTKTPPDGEVRALLSDMRSLYDHVPSEKGLSLSIDGANHFMFSDDGAAVWSSVLLRGLRLIGVLKLDGRRQVAITRYAVRGFFDAYLKQKFTGKLNLLSAQYPELKALDLP